MSEQPHSTTSSKPDGIETVIEAHGRIPLH